MATFCTVLAQTRPKGPQPTTFGHLQTLVDLIDVWPGEKDRMYWSYKSSTEEEQQQVDEKYGIVEHCGTATHPLETVHIHEYYQ